MISYNACDPAHAFSHWCQNQFVWRKKQFVWRKNQFVWRMKQFVWRKNQFVWRKNQFVWRKKQFVWRKKCCCLVEQFVKRGRHLKTFESILVCLCTNLFLEKAVFAYLSSLFKFTVQVTQSF